MPVIGSNILAGASGQAAGDADVGTYTGKSCIFNGSNEFLNKTWGSAASDLDSFTISMWIKRGNTDSGSTQYWLVGALTGAESNIKIQADKINVHLTGSNYDFVGTRVLRDTSAWYHLVFRYDSDEGSAGDRFRCYINGELETWSSSSTIPSGTDNQFFANTNQITIGSYDASSNLFKGYIAQVCACDGQSLAPTSFAETSSDTGAWVMKEPLTGLTFGDNGFLLEFKQTGTGTASTSTIGADTSGETNHLTSTNLVAGDSALEDTPVNNFCTLSPLATSANFTLSEGNLKVDSTSGAQGASLSSIAVNTGKWYAEFKVEDSGNANMIGVVPSSWKIAGSYPYAGGEAGGDGRKTIAYYGNTGVKYDDGSSSSYGDSYTTDDIIGIALDMDNGKVYFSKNGTFQNSSDPAAGSNPAGTGLTGYYHFAPSDGSGSATTGWFCNFGVPSFTGTDQADGNGYGSFEYAPPTDFLALCTANLPEIEIGQEADDLATDYFNTVLYTGNTTTPRTISGVGFEPALTVLSGRSISSAKIVYDDVRGAGSDKMLTWNSTSPEGTDSGNNGSEYGFLSAFNSDGFVLTDGSTNGNWVNNDGSTFVSWNWKAGTAVSGTTTGSGTGKAYSGQVNTDSGVSVITYLGNGSDNHTIPHHLGVAPDFVVTTRRTGTDGWYVFHTKNTSDPSSDYLLLEATQATSDLDSIWSDVVPTSTVVNLGTNTGVNGDDVPYIMYSFANIEGYSKVDGSYVGNGSADGVFCYCGFTPSWVVCKRTDSTGSWETVDNKRTNQTNPIDEDLLLNTADAEYEADRMLFLSNGFKLITTSTAFNANGGTYIFMAFSSGTGFKYATGN
jgi:hypothetical protein